MKRLVLTSVAAFAALASAGAPAPGASVPVAPGFPAWEGVTEKNHVMGRNICPSDLRLKYTSVVVFDAEKFKEQANKVEALSALDVPIHSESVNWANTKIPRDRIVVFSLMGGKVDAAAVKAVFKDPDLAKKIAGGNARIVYANLSFPGAPESAGKRPFLYVMPPKGLEPIYQGAPDSKGVKEAAAAIKKHAKESEFGEWKPFYGYVSEPANFKTFAKTIDSGKPLAALVADLKKKCASKNEAVAVEAQMLYDAVEQTRSDLMFKIASEAASAPHCAQADLTDLLKRWPAEKKKLETYAKRIKANPEFAVLAGVYAKMKTWLDPDFTPKNAAEAKKICDELDKIRKQLAPLKESKTIVSQNVALLLDAEIDELKDLIKAKAPSK